MPIRQVTDQPSWQSGVFTRPYIVKNSGNVTVYLGQDSSLTLASRAFSLPAGSTLNWAGETELWAITDVGEVGELEVLYDANTSFSPGPSTVNTKQSNLPVLIDATSYAIPQAASTFFFQASNIDIRDYASVLITWSAGFNSPAPDWRDNFLIEANQGPQPNQIGTAQNKGVYLLRSTAFGGASLQFPVRDNFLSYRILGRKVFNTAPITNFAAVNVYGSHEQINAQKYYMNMEGLSGDLDTGGAWTLSLSGGAGGATDTSYPNMRNDPAVFNVSNLATTVINANSIAYTLNPARTALVKLTSAFIPTGFNDTNQRQLYLPSRPLIIVSTAGANSGVEASINA